MHLISPQNHLFAKHQNALVSPHHRPKASRYYAASFEALNLQTEPRKNISNKHKKLVMSPRSEHSSCKQIYAKRWWFLGVSSIEWAQLSNVGRGTEKHHHRWPLALPSFVSAKAECMQMIETCMLKKLYNLWPELVFPFGFEIFPRVANTFLIDAH